MTYTPLDINKLNRKYPKTNAKVDFVFVGIGLITVFVFSVVAYNLVEKNSNLSILHTNITSMR